MSQGKSLVGINVIAGTSISHPDPDWNQIQMGQTGSGSRQAKLVPQRISCWNLEEF
jgi:hypothetical protein